MSYQLGFISDEDLFNHVKDTVDKYRFKIHKRQFIKNEKRGNTKEK